MQLRVFPQNRVAVGGGALDLVPSQPPAPGSEIHGKGILMPEDGFWGDDRSSWSLSLPEGGRVRLEHVGTQPHDHLRLDVSFETKDDHLCLVSHLGLRFSRDEWCRAVVQMRPFLQDLPPEMVTHFFDSDGVQLLKEWPDQVAPPFTLGWGPRRPNIDVRMDSPARWTVHAALYFGEFQEARVEIFGLTWLRVFSASLTVWASPPKPDWRDQIAVS